MIEYCLRKIIIYFESACSPNNQLYCEQQRVKYKAEIANCSGDYLRPDLFDAKNVALSAAKLDNGKSPGIDGLTSEHITNCHPIIYSILARLFNIMVYSSYVPVAYGTGITIPIPKNDCTRGAQKIESFRGITLSPVISKIFEHCIM